MNKNLEKEYKELMEENVPDLWARIEAGLESEPKSEAKAEPAGKKPIPWRKYSAWGMAAAACLCLIIIAPFLLPQITGGNLGTGPNDYSGGTSNAGAATTGGDEFAGAATTGGYEFADSATTWEDDFVGAAEAPEGGSDGEYEESGEMPPVYTVKVRLEMIDKEDVGTTYYVQVVESDVPQFPKETYLILHGKEIDGENIAGEEPVEGEEYWVDFAVIGEDQAVPEYLVEDMRKE